MVKVIFEDRSRTTEDGRAIIPRKRAPKDLLVLWEPDVVESYWECWECRGLLKFKTQAEAQKHYEETKHRIEPICIVDW